MKRILIDLDGTVADFVSVVLEDYNRDYDDNLTADAITSYGMHEIVKPECGRDIYKYFHAKGTFERCGLIPGALKAIQRLEDAGHDIYFVTKPVDHSLYCLFEKQHWVDKNFPTISHKKVIFTGCKYMVSGDLLIDDHVHNLWDFPGRRILVDAPWNRHIKDEAYLIERFTDWDSIVNAII